MNEIRVILAPIIAWEKLAHNNSSKNQNIYFYSVLPSAPVTRNRRVEFCSKTLYNGHRTERCLIEMPLTENTIHIKTKNQVFYQPKIQISNTQP